MNPDKTLKWKYDVGLCYGSASAIGQDGTLYCSTWNDTVYAIGPDGTLKWSAEGGGNPDASVAVGSDGTIYVPSGFAVRAFNPDGSLKWEAQTFGGYISGGTSIGENGSIYVATEIPAGNSMFEEFDPLGNSTGLFSTGGWSTKSSPAIGEDETIYWGSFDAYLYALSTLDPADLRWSFKTGGNVYCTPLVGDDGVIYFDSYDGNLYALNPDGSLRWSYDLGDISDCCPAIGDDGTIYVVGSEWIEGSGYSNYLYAIASSSKGLAQSPWPKFQHDNRNTGRVGGGGAIVEQPAELPTISLSASLVSGRIHVSYTIPEGQSGVLRAVLQVYNVSGQRVAQTTVTSSGEVEFSEPFSRGVYFVRLEAGTLTLVRKAVVIE